MAKQPNSPKMMMVVPVPMRTYGALVEFSAIREMYGPSMNFPHSPTAKRMAPVICTQTRAFRNIYLNQTIPEHELPPDIYTYTGDLTTHERGTRSG